MKFNCKNIVTYYPRKKIIKGVYKLCNNKFEGEYISWYSNGNMKAHYHYHEGNLEGRCIEYYMNGQIQRDYYCHEGRYDGEYIGYFSSGKVDVHYIYRNNTIVQVIKERYQKET